MDLLLLVLSKKHSEPLNQLRTGNVFS